LVWDELHFWGRGGFKGGEEGSYMAEAYPAVPGPRPEFEENLKANFRDMIRERRSHPSIIAWSLGNETIMQMEEPLLSEVKRLFLELNALAHELDPTRPTGMGNAYMGIADIEGFNGGGPEKKNGHGPILTTEFHFGHEPERDAWRSGAICWSGIDYGTHCARQDGTSFGYFGAVDYHRLPREKYGIMREQATGIPVPERPGEGTAARLTLTADKRVMKNDGTDDALLIVAVLDKDGKRVANDIPVSLKIIAGPGLLPTGNTWETSTSNMGRQAIEFRSYEAGKTVIEVSSPGVEPARIEITAVDSGGIYE
jgi:beta-galactosidase